MMYSLFHRHNSFCTVFWVSSFYLSVNIVVLYTCRTNSRSRVLKTSCLELKREVSRTEKKGSRLRLCFRVVYDVPAKKGMDLWKQMSSSKCSFTCICGILLPLKLNPSTTAVYARSAFYPSLRFTLSLQSAFYTQSAFYPWSAVCSPQSAFDTDRLHNGETPAKWQSKASFATHPSTETEWPPKLLTRFSSWRIELHNDVQESL